MNHHPSRPQQVNLHSWRRRLTLLFAGLFLFGVGVAIMAQSRMGLGPWEVFHQGISRHTGLEIGTASILVGIPVLLGWIPLGQKPGIGTVLNILCIGVVTNAALRVLPLPEMLPMRLLWMVAGILTIGVGSGMYLSAQLGAGPRDGLMMGIYHRTGLSVRVSRTVVEVTVLILGGLLGGTIGLGTLGFAFGIGPVVQIVLHLLGAPPKNQQPIPVSGVIQPDPPLTH
jgi:uncharacterized membrane protein YczE